MWGRPRSQELQKQKEQPQAIETFPIAGVVVVVVVVAGLVVVVFLKHLDPGTEDNLPPATPFHVLQYQKRCVREETLSQKMTVVAGMSTLPEFLVEFPYYLCFFGCKRSWSRWH